MKQSKTMISRRRKKLLEYLQEHKKAGVAELSAILQVTAATVRRDIQFYEEKGYVKRYFGGVRYILPPNSDVQYRTPQGNPTSAKYAIAKAAAALIQEGDTVFFNSSSTALFILDYLKDINIILITNNGRALYARRDPGVSLFLTGGEVYGNKQSLVGELSLEPLSKITATKCFLGVSGISVEGDITSKVIQETAINQQMLRQCSGQKVVVADGSKIGARHNFFSCRLSEITHLITDSTADRAELERIRQQGIEVIVVDAGKGQPPEGKKI